MGEPAPCHAVTVFEESTAALAKWVADALKSHAIVAESGLHQSPCSEFLPKVIEALDALPKETPCLVIAVFWHGTNDESKKVFLSLKEWAATRPLVALQAMNAKQGTHTICDNEDALMTSLKKRLPKAAAPAPAVASPAGGEQDGAPSWQLKGGDEGTRQADGDVNFDDITAANVAKRVFDCQGECTWVITATTGPEFEEKVSKLKAAATESQASAAPMCTSPKQDGTKTTMEFVVRRNVAKEHIELRLAMCGNVDSGKSTLTSVLTCGFKDDGRGLARSRVFNHKHEQATGRTSSISENHLGFDSVGDVVNYPKGGPMMGVKNVVTAQEMSERGSKIITLYDLAGHEKYLKTTVLGMTRSQPDYACIVISANNGIQRMTKEHLGLCLALRLPFFVVITRIDATPDNIRQQTFQTVNKLLKMPTVKKLPYPVKREEDIIVCAKNLRADRITPIFEVSNVTGQGIDDVLKFLNLLPVRKDWRALSALPKEMVIDSTFFVTGVGTVVGGIITQGTFKPNDSLLLGPDAYGQFRPAQVKSIHVKGVEVDHVDAGNDAALCLKKEKRNAIRKGNVLVDASIGFKAYWQFESEIVILYHSTTISSNYEPVIHSQTVRQSARIILDEDEVLRTGDRAVVRFHFLYRPEYIKVGQRLIFREGRTKGIGTVMRVHEGIDDKVVLLTKTVRKEQYREKHEKGTAKE